MTSRLRGGPEPPPHPSVAVIAKVSTADNPTLGKPDAPITIVEFSDYQCPFCRRFFENTLPALKADYIDIGTVRYVFRDFPLDRIHPQARKAAEAARCAGEQGQYWEMHDQLFQNRALRVLQLKGYARNLGLDLTAFEACLDGGTYAAEVDKDVAAGATAERVRAVIDDERERSVHSHVYSSSSVGREATVAAPQGSVKACS